MLLGLASTVILLLVGLLFWNRAHPPAPITLEPQEQAATTSGVERAANAAQVTLSPSQAAAIASVIKKSEDKAPDAVLQTTGAKLEETIQAELKKSGTQFAIVTDPKHPASIPVLPSAIAAPTKVEPIAPSAPITLNQYNIKAYPGRLFQMHLCRLSALSEQPTSSEINEWYELAEKVKNGTQPDAAIFIEGISERKIAAMAIEKIADIIESNSGQLMFCWR